MPIYTYKCKECGHERDMIRMIEEREYWAECPKCRGEMELKLTAYARTNWL